jgi:hypothetical protein
MDFGLVRSALAEATMSAGEDIWSDVGPMRERSVNWSLK